MGTHLWSLSVATTDLSSADGPLARGRVLVVNGAHADQAKRPPQARPARKGVIYAERLHAVAHERCGATTLVAGTPAPCQPPQRPTGSTLMARPTLQGEDIPCVRIDKEVGGSLHRSVDRLPSPT